MRKVRHITVAVSPELYRQTRHLAAEYDTTVTALVAYLLERMPKALQAARFPVGGPKPPAPPLATGQTPVNPETQLSSRPLSTAECLKSTFKSGESTATH